MSYVHLPDQEGKEFKRRMPSEAAGGRQRDTIVDTSEAPPPYTENRNLGWGGRCSLSVYVSIDLALRYSQTVLTRCFEGAPLSQPTGIHAGIQAEAQIAPLIKSWEPESQREMGASSGCQDRNNRTETSPQQGKAQNQAIVKDVNAMKSCIDKYTVSLLPSNLEVYIQFLKILYNTDYSSKAMMYLPSSSG